MTDTPNSQSSTKCANDSPSSIQDAEMWSVDVEFWDFDGNFQKMQETISMEVPNGPDETLPITDLSLVPITFAEPDLIKHHKNVGLEFWKSRFRRYVSYRAMQDIGNASYAEPRYMIDPATQNKLHPKDRSKEPLQDDLGPEWMHSDEPPPDPFLLLLPRKIHGFNMQNKRWEELEVDRISDVSWNKEAFDTLVIDPFTKTLIKALIMQQLAKEKGTDVIAGKGQGLIALLHGGPGTGKTFTAETVAELAEKPFIESLAVTLVPTLPRSRSTSNQSCISVKSGIASFSWTKPTCILRKGQWKVFLAMRLCLSSYACLSTMRASEFTHQIGSAHLMNPSNPAYNSLYITIS